MKTEIMAVSKWGLVLASVFAPFLLVLSMLLAHPVVERIYLETNLRDALSWIWLMLAAAMMLGVYFLTAYVAFDAFKHERPAR